MNKAVLNRSLAALAVAGIVLPSCGDDDDSSGSTGAPETTAAPGTTAGGSETTAAPGTTAGGSPTTSGGGAAVDLASVCPDPIVIQTDWFPESEHGALYNLVGEGYEV